VRSAGTVRVWYRDEGWGVIDSPDTPGGCWAGFGQIWNDYEVPECGPGDVLEIETYGGIHELSEGQTVDFEWERTSAPGGQDGYSFRATTVRPYGSRPPRRVIRQYRAGPTGYRLEMGPLKRRVRNNDE
jgi:cold shock CspA family protein